MLCDDPNDLEETSRSVDCGEHSDSMVLSDPEVKHLKIVRIFVVFLSKLLRQYFSFHKCG